LILKTLYNKNHDSTMTITQQLFWIIAAACLTMSACKPKESPGETTITSDKPLADRMPKAPPVNPYTTPEKGFFLSPAAPAASPITTTLLTHYWIFEHYIHSQEFDAGKSNEGRWYQFKPDGSFIAGQWEETKSKGSWGLGVGEGDATVLTIDSDNNAEDAQWILQISRDGDEMSWVGVRETSYQGHIIKVINLMTIPTKKQFGKE
jgi:hypothetical protein